MILHRFGFAVGIATIGLCVVLHMATFIATPDFRWLFVCFGFLGIAVLCAKAVEEEKRVWEHGWLILQAALLFVYCGLLFVHYYRTTGGSSGVEITDGRYVSTYWSGHRTKVITKAESEFYLNLWIRVMTAGMGGMATICLAQFAPSRKTTEKSA